MFSPIFFPNLVTGCEGSPITFLRVQYPKQSETEVTPYLEPLNSSCSFRNQVTFEKSVFGIPCTGKQSKSLSKDHSKHFHDALLGS